MRYSCLTVVVVCFGTSSLASADVILKDDGTGFNPDTAEPNAWEFAPGWQANMTAAQVADLPEYSGTAAAAEMLAQLGAANSLIVADAFGDGMSVSSVGGLSGPLGGMLFEQAAFVDLAPLGLDVVRATFLFDSFELSGRMVEPGLFEYRLRAPMYVLLLTESAGPLPGVVVGGENTHSDWEFHTNPDGTTGHSHTISSTQSRITSGAVGFFSMPDVDVALQFEAIPGPSRFKSMFGMEDEGCTGDMNGDASVGMSDLLVLLESWGPCPGCPADLDGNGSVGFTDLLVVLSAWGLC